MPLHRGVILRRPDAHFVADFIDGLDHRTVNPVTGNITDEHTVDLQKINRQRAQVRKRWSRTVEGRIILPHGKEIWRLHKGLGIPAEALIQPPNALALQPKRRPSKA
jgi:hypothetical protein